MSKCQYCQGDYANPFKFAYSPLWFAWRPVSVGNRIVFLKKVHRNEASGSSSNFVGSYPVFWYEYTEHES